MKQSPNEIAGNLRDAFGDRLYGMITRHRREDEVVQEARLRERAKRYGFSACRGERSSLSHAGPPAAAGCFDGYSPWHSCGFLRPKAQANAEYAFQSPYTFASLFADDPAAIVRTQEIAERCSFSLTEIRYRYPSEHLPDGTTSAEWLRQLTFEGAHQRYGSEIPANVVDQLEKELKIIEALDYPATF